MWKSIFIGIGVFYLISIICCVWALLTEEPNPYEVSTQDLPLQPRRWWDPTHYDGSVK